VLPEQRRLRIPTSRQLDEIRLQELRYLELSPSSQRLRVWDPEQCSSIVEIANHPAHDLGRPHPHHQRRHRRYRSRLCCVRLPMRLHHLGRLRFRAPLGLPHGCGSWSTRCAVISSWCARVTART
jgi:hypothetical protein